MDTFKINAPKTVVVSCYDKPKGDANRKAIPITLKLDAWSDEALAALIAKGAARLVNDELSGEAPDDKLRLYKAIADSLNDGAGWNDARGKEPRAAKGTGGDPVMTRALQLAAAHVCEAVAPAGKDRATWKEAAADASAGKYFRVSAKGNVTLNVGELIAFMDRNRESIDFRAEAEAELKAEADRAKRLADVKNAVKL
jgi:hypothetical protein